MTSKTMSHLPVPMFADNLSYSFKEFHNSGNVNSIKKSKKPPKLLPKFETSFNRSSTSTAHAISFKEKSGNDSTAILSPIYCKEKNLTYFEQCFEQISKIGEGSFGEVFKVKSKEDGRYYAIKKSKSLFRGENYRQERLEEVRRYEEFSEHEHCVTLYKAWQEDNRLYMQMDLYKCSLEGYVFEKRDISEELVWSFLLDLLLALKSLHDKNLIHLDIKLDNILVTEDEVCKLGDFGLVVDINRSNLKLATEGDARYVAPEVLRGQFSKAADIFSLGITILELSCNLILPPNGPLWKELRSGVFPKEFTTLLTLELQHIIKWMMDPEPINRPSVDTLLSYPKLQGLIRKRKSKFIYIRKIKKYIMNFLNIIIKNWCNLKNNLSHLLTLKHKKNDHRIPLLAQEENLFLHSTPKINISKVDSPYNTKTCDFDIATNSTPLSHHYAGYNTNRVKEMKDFPRTYLSFEISDDELQDEKLIGKNNDDSSVTNSSSLCKKLFDISSDSE